MPNFSSIAVPLTDLTKKGLPNHVRWGDAQELAFHSLKRLCALFPILKLPDITESFFLQTDASENSVGVVLLQVEDEIRRLVAYASRNLSKSERSYATIEKKSLACVWGRVKIQSLLVW